MEPVAGLCPPFDHLQLREMGHSPFPLAASITTVNLESGCGSIGDKGMSGNWKSWLIVATAMLVLIGIFIALFNLPVVTGDVPA